MPSRSRGDRAEHDRRVALERRVEEPAGAHRAAERVEQRRVDGLDRQAAGLAGGRSGRSGGPRSASTVDGARRLDRADAPDHRHRVVGQLRRRRRGTTGPARHGEQVRPELVEDGEQRRPARVRDREHRDHRRDADGDADGGQRRPEPARRRARGRAIRATSIGPGPCATSAVIRLRGRSTARSRRSATIRPSCSSTRRGSDAARSRSWVMTAIVAPSVALRSRNRSTSAAPVAESRLPVGSSARTIAGRPTSARATATRWRSPPDSWPGRCFARCAEPDPVQRRRRRPSPVLARTPAVEQPVGDVVERGLAAQQVEVLEHEPDPPRPERGQPPVGQAVDPLAGDRDLAARRPVERAEHVEQRRLAGPGRPDDREQLPGVDRRGRRRAARPRAARPGSAARRPAAR